MDIWSVGCVIYELFTGKILFPGKTNNEMLKLMMDVKGPFPKKMLKKGAFANMHFEDDAATSFCLLDIDPLTKRPVRFLAYYAAEDAVIRSTYAKASRCCRWARNSKQLFLKAYESVVDKGVSLWTVRCRTT